MVHDASCKRDAFMSLRMMARRMMTSRFGQKSNAGGLSGIPGRSFRTVSATRVAALTSTSNNGLSRPVTIS